MSRAIPPFLFILSSSRVQKNYRDYRENLPSNHPASSLNPFPLHGFDTLDIESTNTQSGKWPDADGKYWWRIELNNGEIITDFYWMEDKERGYPGTDDKGNQYWCYKIGYRDEPPLAGFSQEPDYSQGKFAGKGEFYCYNFTFDDRFCDIIRECEALYDLEYLDDLEKNNPELYRQEITDLEDKNDPNGILPRHQERQQQTTVHAAAVADTTTEDVEASAFSQPAASTLDNLSQRLTTLELRVNDISSADKRADRRRERRNTRSRQHMEPLAIESSVNQGQVQALSEQALAQQFEQAQQHAAMMLQRQLTALVSEQEAKAEQQRHDLETNIARIEAEIKQCRSSSSSSSSDTQAAVNTTLHQLRQRQQQLTQVLRPLHEEQQQRLARQQQLAYITQHPDESIRTLVVPQIC